MDKADKTAVPPPSIINQAKDRFADITADLFSIEVNTILRDDITAQKMPNPRHALIDIGQAYNKAMMQMETVYGKSAKGIARSGTIRTTRNAPEMMERDVGKRYGSFNGFDGLHAWAERLLNDAYSGKINLHADQIAILPRIRDNSDLLKAMFTNIVRGNPNAASELQALTNNYSREELNGFQSTPPLLLTEQQLILVRKVWELGTEVIVMQTVVQVDGDVITRLNAHYLNHAHYSKIQNYHNKGIEIALEHWAGLVKVAQDLLVAIGKGLGNALK